MPVKPVQRLKLAAWNADGVRSKKYEISYFIKQHSIKIFLLNETRLTPSDNFEIKGFHVARMDRSTNSHYGGVAILVHNSIQFKILPSINCSMENVGIQVLNGPRIICVYNSPSNNFRITCLEKLLNCRETLVIGDLNAKHGIWGISNLKSNGNGRTLLKFLEKNADCNIHHSPNPTLYPYNGTSPSTVDILLAKSFTRISEIESLPDLPSDHNVIKFEIFGNFRDNTSKNIFDYSNTNWNEFRKILNHKVVVNNDINSADCLEQEISKFSECLTYARNRTTKIKKIYPHTVSLPPHIVDLIRLRNRTRKRWQRFRDPLEKMNSESLSRMIKREIQLFKNQEWNNKLQKLNPSDGSLWKVTKTLKKNHFNMPQLNHDSNIFATDEQKTELLAKTFEKAHNLDRSDSDPDRLIENTVSEFLRNSNHRDTESNKHLTNPSDLKELIKTLPPNKSAGLDEIDNKLIKNLPQKSIVQLTYLVNAIIKLGHWPNSWKTALVIPIHKTGKDKHSPLSYRPISLLTTLSKLTEKVLSNILKKTLEKTEIHDPFQFGFKENHSSTHQLARIVTDIINAFNKRQNTTMVLLDIEKAFDRVWVQGLLYKMITLKLPSFVIKLINSYLLDRKFIVKLNHTLSDPITISAGVPQGSILGPKLFNLYIHDLPAFPNTKTALFADDTAVYAHSYSATVASKLLQYHLQVLMDYYNKWKIKVNSNKTEMIVFSRRINDKKLVSPLKFNNQVIKQKDYVKYLGITLDSRLNFHKHIITTLGKAYAVKRTLHPLLHKNSTLSIENKKLTYTSLIRPIITYAAPIWCHLKPTPLSPLQKFQNQILRMVLNKSLYTRTRVSTLHEISGIETLKEHIDKIASKFYEKSCYVSDPVNRITKIRFCNKNRNCGHVLPYEHLPIFQKEYHEYSYP